MIKMMGGESELEDRTQLAFEEAKEAMRVKEIKRNPDGTTTMITRQGGRLLAHRLYPFSPEIGRALPSNIEELSKPKPWYIKLKEYLFG